MRSKIFGLLGVSGLVLGSALKSKSLLCAGGSDAETTAAGLDKIYQDRLPPTSPAELEAMLQESAKGSEYFKWLIIILLGNHLLSTC